MSFVALLDDQLVGHARIDMASYRVAGLGMMVDAAAGPGVGGALVRAVIDAAGDLGAHKIALQVWPHNEAARRLYLRHGFVEEGLLRRHYPRRNGQLWDAVSWAWSSTRRRPDRPTDYLAPTFSFTLLFALSTTPAAVPATRFPGGVSGARGWGLVGAVFLAFSKRLAQLGQLLALDDLAHLGEELGLLLLHVVADALDHHRHLGLEPLVVRASCPRAR